MKRSVPLFLLVSFAVAGSLFVPVAPAAGSPPEDAGNGKAQAHARVGGQEIPIQVGSVIAQGRLIAQGANDRKDAASDETCRFDDRIGIGADIPDGASPLDIVSTVQPDCSVVITSITTMTTAAEPVPSGGAGAVIPSAPSVGLESVNPNYTLYGSTSQNAYLGWVKGIVQEQFGVTSTERYEEFRWLQSPSGVQRPHANDGYCYHSAFPGIWKISNCYYVTHDDAPGLVWKEGWGDYEYYPCPLCQGIGWRHYVVFDGYVGGWAYDCFLYGDLPPAWDHRCRGGRDRLQ